MKEFTFHFFTTKSSVSIDDSTARIKTNPFIKQKFQLAKRTKFFLHLIRNPFLLITLLWLVSFDCKHTLPTAKDVLSGVSKKFDAHHSISYSVSYSIKYFNKNKPITVHGDGKLIRENTDSLLGGYIWFSTKDSTVHYEKYYDLNTICFIDNVTRKVTNYDTHKKESWAMTGNITYGEVLLDFLLPTRLLDLYNDTTNKLKLSRDTIGDKVYWNVSIAYADQDGFSKMRRNIWIDPNDSTIRKITYHADFQGQTETKEWNFTQIAFDGFTQKDLDNQVKSQINNYVVDTYAPPDSNYYKLLANGTAAPEFSGTLFQSGKEVKLEDYRGQVVILDFWYMSCINCIHEFPSILKIEDKYKDKGLVVLGINSVDTTAQGKKLLPNFIDQNKISFPIVLTQRSTDNFYNVKGYPALYVINTKGKIVFSQLGYSPKIEGVLDSVIEREVKLR